MCHEVIQTLAAAGVVRDANCLELCFFTSSCEHLHVFVSRTVWHVLAYVGTYATLKFNYSNYLL